MKLDNYHVIGEEDIISPALIYYKNAIIENTKHTIELAKDDAEASHKILEDEAAFTALLRHNLDLSHSTFSEEELDTLLVKQFKAFCEDEAKRRAAGTKTTLRLFTQAIPALLKLK